MRPAREQAVESRLRPDPGLPAPMCDEHRNEHVCDSEAVLDDCDQVVFEGNHVIAKIFELNHGSKI